VNLEDLFTKLKSYSYNIDKPVDPNGVLYIDVKDQSTGKIKVVIEYFSVQGLIGVTAMKEGMVFGGRPDFMCNNIDSAINKLEELMK
jgi:outer membrane protein assembly factor BamA